jgi:hypothetical protein
MARKTFLALLVGLLLTPSLRAEISAHRAPGETFEAARNRQMPTVRFFSTANPTAYEAAVHLKDLDATDLPTQLKIQELFELVRDSRYLISPMQPAFSRRSSWLYPQDGCWVRASVSRRLAKTKGYGDLKKLFIFGSLRVTTKNAPGGVVSWWYHVVPVFANELGEAMVMDPAIDPSAPLLLEDWAHKMVAKSEDATYSICSPSTYDPSSACAQPDPEADKYASIDQVDYLNWEWDNLIALSRDPRKELADLPPWIPVRP